MRAAGEWILGLGALIPALGGGAYALPRIKMEFRGCNLTERIIVGFLARCSLIAILTTMGIVHSLIAEALRFFARVPLVDFLFGLNWSPQMAIREDQLGMGKGAFGAVPVFLEPS